MKKHMDRTVLIIPARYHSKRFDGKLLKSFNKKPILWWAINNSLKMKFADECIVATPDSEIKAFTKELPGVSIVDVDGSCGTEKVFRYYISIDNTFDYYASYPADEPVVDPKEVNYVWEQIKQLLDSKADIVTLWTKFYNEEDLRSNLSCKMVLNRHDRVLYFSRSIIPATKNGKLLELSRYKKHVGMFFFSKRTFTKCNHNFWYGWHSDAQDIEGLEQNRFIDAGLQVYALEIKHIGFGIDKPEQIKQLEERLKNDNIQRSG